MIIKLNEYYFNLDHYEKFKLEFEEGANGLYYIRFYGTSITRLMERDAAEAEFNRLNAGLFSQIRDMQEGG